MGVAVLGAGNMGIALAQILALREQKVRLWDYNPRTVAAIKRAGINKRFLPDVKLSRRIMAEASMERAVARTQLVIVACASPYVRETVRKLGRYLHFAPTPPNLPTKL